jgi:hypothetical protein
MEGDVPSGRAVNWESCLEMAMAMPCNEREMGRAHN